MKKKYFLFLLVLFPLLVSAKVEIDGIYYDISSNGTNKASVTSKPNSAKYSGDVVIPKSVTYNDITYSVTSIDDDAFSGCSGLTSVTIPNSVAYIGRAAFYGCWRLTSVTIPSSVLFMNKNAFEDCNGLTSVHISDLAAWCKIMFDDFSNPLMYAGHLFLNGEEIIDLVIPSSVSSIGYCAFEGYRGLTSVTIPRNVTSIEWYAFSRCSGLTTVVSELEEPFEISYNAFDNDTYSNATLYVPKGTKVAYQSTAGWNNFKNIVEASSSSYAISPKRTINVATAGTLSNIISDDEKYGIEELTLTGSLNGTDFRLLREMAGRDVKGEKTDGILKVLDISGARIVLGGERYFDIPGGIHFSIEKNDVVPEYVFHDCSLIEIALPNGAKVIEDEAFENCSVLRTVTIPDGITTIGEETFNGCKRLSSLQLPKSITSIGLRAFADCIELASVNSEVVKPFAISDDVFSSTTYNNARLVVPENTLSAYKSTNGWKRFNTIVEYIASERINADGVEYLCSFDDLSASVVKVSNSLKDVRIPSTVKGKGGEYTVSSIEDNAFYGCVLNYLSLPATITTLTEKAFSLCKMCSMSWNADTQLNKKAFRNTTMSTDSNFLLYVKSADCAPNTVANIIVNNTAQSIILSDNGDEFYCPISFTAKKISFTHHFSMETGGSGKGWETIALPFDVQKVTHSTKGEIVPFALYNSSSSKKPFWLYRYGSNGTGEGFVSANSIQANTPYIVAMPNQSGYQSSYLLNGDVTFSSENVQVVRTPDFSGKFVPTYVPVQRSSNIYALNVINSYVNNTGVYDAGSRFISNLRDIRPFEAYFSQGSSTRSVIEINLGNGTTNMDALFNEENSNTSVKIYTLSGKLVEKTSQGNLEGVINNLPKGVYVVNGKKIVR